MERFEPGDGGDPQAPLLTSTRSRPGGHSPGVTTASLEDGARQLDPRRWAGLVVILAATFLGVLDFFIVNVSIPALKNPLPPTWRGATDAEVQLMIALYGLAYAVCLVTGGRLGDIYGRRRLFRIGVAGFTLASALCGLALDPAMLIVARVFQGITGAMMFPQVLSIIQVTFPPRERALAFGVFGAVLGAGSFAGNVLGGVLVQADLGGMSWRPIFLVNLPVGVLTLIASGYLVPESWSSHARKLDLGGVVLASMTLFLFVYPLVQGREAGWPWWAFVCMAAALPLLGVFLRYERRVGDRGGAPLVDLHLFRDRVFCAGLLATFVFYSGLSTFFLTVTIFLQDGLGFTPRAAGLTFAPFAVGFLFSSTSAVKLTARLGSRLVNLGTGLMALAVALLVLFASLQGTSVKPAVLVVLLLIYGTGQGFASPTLVSTVLSNTPSYAAGSAAGVLTTVQQVSVALGITVIGDIFFAVLGPPPAQHFVAALTTALLCNFSLLVATFGLMFLLPRHLHADNTPHLDV